MNVKGILSIVVLGLFVGCLNLETPPGIDYGNDSVAFLNDTTYLLDEGDIPAAQGLNVMIDDFTGIRCTNCPEVTAAAKNLAKLNPGRIFVTVHYPQSPANLTTPYSGYVDIRTAYSQTLAADVALYSNQLPAHTVNRKVFPGEINANLAHLDTSNWQSLATGLLSENAKVNLDASINRTSDSTIELQGNFVFQEAFSEDVYVSIAILENGIKQPQSGPDSTIYNYKHSHVLREMYTQPTGNLLLSASEIQRGTKVEKGWLLSIPDYIDQNNAELVIDVIYNSATSHEIIQCLKINLN